MNEKLNKRKNPLNRAGEWLRGSRYRQAVAYFLLGLVVLLGFLFLAQHWLGSFGLAKAQADFWDAVFKGMGGLVAIVGATVALSKYFDEREKANRAALIEAQKPFSTKRQEVYFQLVSATSTIGNRGSDDPLRKDAENQFWQLYWGAVPMVADDQVGAAVNAFHDAVLDYKDDGVRLRNLSMNLATACRKSLGFVESDLTKL
jgi:hypothetical protein